MGLASDELLDLTPRQFFNGLKGKYDYEGTLSESKRNLLFAAMRFNATHIAAGLSGDLAKKISKISFDWETKKLTAPKDIISNFDKEFYSK